MEKIMEEKQVRSWTDEQLSAINNRDKTLLVSAAAGSGKTATLTERIIRSLTDKDAPKDIGSMLIVTFTKAATGELRAKITKALTDACEADPENKRLQKQLYMLPTAKIRTIDAFCNDILKNNTDAAGISPSYRLCEGAEEELLMRSLMNAMIDSIYCGELSEVASSEEFERLTDCLTESKKNEDLSDTFRYIYYRCDAEIEGVGSLLPLIEEISPKKFESIEKSRHGSYLMSKVKAMASHYLKGLLAQRREFAVTEGAEEKYVPIIESDIAAVKTVSQTNSYTEAREVMMREKTFVDLPSIKKGKTEKIEDYQAFRKYLREDFVSFKKYFYYTEEQWKKLYSDLYGLLLVFYRFLDRFDKIFFEEKKRRGIFSYTDIARLAYQCLMKDGKPTDIAENMKRQFSDIYIDEYQDVNPLQNGLFEAISRDDNRFMVGDIKQSIYVFRKAKPEIFAKMKATFPKLSEANGSYASIFMSKNFRSDKAVIDFVNGIFDRIFGLCGESIGYEKADRLTVGKDNSKYGELPYRKPELCLYSKKSCPEGGEAMIVAKKIKKLLDEGETLNSGEPIKPSDIAILMRSAEKKAPLYRDALESLGIPSLVAAKDDFFLTPEVLLTLSVLNSIDNPRRDIYLAGYMCSPIASFTADELYIIRNETREETLYDSLVTYCSRHPEFKKGGEFLDRLNYYRMIAEDVTVPSLLNKIYQETGLLSLAAKNGGKDNLMMLYDYSRSYEAGAYKGLYNFIHFINNISEKRDTEFDEKRDGASANAVRIITCHSSKGLEYPVVFLAECGTRIANKDAAKRVVFSDEMGFAFRMRTPSGLLPADNPVRDIINLYNYSKMYEEELRILYVALTRARERLYLVGQSAVDDTEKYLERCRMLKEGLDEYSAENLSSFLEIMLVASDGIKVSDAYEFIGESRKDAEEPTEGEEEKESDNNEEKEEEQIDTELKEELVRRFNYNYPTPTLSTLPEKLSVSKTSPTVLDGSDDFDAELIGDKDDEKKSVIPSFIRSIPEDESAKRGIATHYLLQFADLEYLYENGAEAELSRLRSGGFISKEDACRVRIDEIELFRSSELFLRMRRAKKLYREFRFTMKIPAEELTGNEDKALSYLGKEVLVQGVIDCIVEDEDGELSVCDYKTDRLTRAELSDKSLAEQTMRRKHSTQLYYYKRAVKEIFGKEPKRVEVYSLMLGDTVSVE